jgi:hypothetical protein
VQYCTVLTVLTVLYYHSTVCSTVLLHRRSFAAILALARTVLYSIDLSGSLMEAATISATHANGDWRLLVPGIDHWFSGHDIVVLGVWAGNSYPSVLQEGGLLREEECCHWSFHVITDVAAFRDHLLPIDELVVRMLIWFRPAAFGVLAARRHMHWQANEQCWRCLVPLQAEDVWQVWMRDVTHKVWRPLWGPAAASWAPAASFSSSDEATEVAPIDPTRRNRKRARTDN